jgi:division protein CdvB (Snf7/Vps24/ESCRT-III family)
VKLKVKFKEEAANVALGIGDDEEELDEELDKLKEETGNEEDTEAKVARAFLKEEADKSSPEHVAKTVAKIKDEAIAAAESNADETVCTAPMFLEVDAALALKLQKDCPELQEDGGCGGGGVVVDGRA